MVEVVELREAVAGLVEDGNSVVPHGAHPSYADGYYDRDNAFYASWGPISRDRDRFKEWMERHVLGVEDFAEHLRSIRKEAFR